MGSLTWQRSECVLCMDLHIRRSMCCAHKGEIAIDESAQVLRHGPAHEMRLEKQSYSMSSQEIEHTASALLH